MQKQNAGSCTITFRINQRAPLIVVNGFVNDKGPIDFIVDTGASLTMLSREMAKRAGIRLDGKKAKAAGPDGAQTVTLVTVGLLTIGDIQVRNLKMAVMDFGLLNHYAQTKAEGILGFNFLKRFHTQINYASRQICFSPAQLQKRPGSPKRQRPARRAI